ncbi:(2Fe-2S)-binding protein [Corynebacterium sp. ES2794-CONJ1]|uniref:(2Fe-2S)-binding protein n=1 Tax=unclassified Corynebacterium TaxID=2624378 RepID=UPI0021692F04|nr:MULTISPECIES: (2Fe-2S)-binding protein [unclassified Corynebacterium]MCS4489859.1 (2Fe-2S)-binding protein [Corynebacterium sp. ES2775-CONJ]MCS4491777.1 (2Fe-2S)-binding protein [Corynebacterium sp. ES2715-CONJ3]MCS4531882.1 (2Fe-2S)-binding protein [Corynebacterium sp. ES2730-CONJ]MCU9519279.1 (2Fe-2S)-binding protein [Corynebacterium sp. ES2794-CONJ1]
MSVAGSLAQVVSATPRYAISVEPSDEALIMSPDDLCDESIITAAISQSEQEYGVAKHSHAARIWLFSLMGSVCNPAVAAMIHGDDIIDLDLRTGTLFRREDSTYWFGFRPQNPAESYAASARHLASNLKPLINKLCEVYAMRPAPLWAIVADGLVQPAMSAGNEEFEQLKALHIARELHRGICEVAEVKIPRPHFVDVVDEDVVPLDLTTKQEPEFLAAYRSSCCMIYRSPHSDYCVSCPKRPRAQRDAAIVASAQFF